MEATLDSLKTVGKMVLSTGSGMILSLQDYESVFRMLSIFVTTTLSIMIFIINYRKSKKRKDEEKTD